MRNYNENAKKFFSRVNHPMFLISTIGLWMIILNVVLNVFFYILRITKLAAANVTIELRDSGMLRHVTTQVCSHQETFTANFAPVRVAPSVCGCMGSQGVQMGIAPMTL